MSGKTFILAPAPHPARQNCLAYIANTELALDGMYVEIHEETRTQEQNRLLWPLLNLWAKNVKMAVNGEMIYVTREAWKVAHLADFRHQHGNHTQFALTPGGILVPLGFETHKMLKGEFKDFLTYLLAESTSRRLELPPRMETKYTEWLGRNAA